MANTVRITAGVNDQASKPIRDIRDAWLRLQRDGQQGLTAGIAAAASIKAFNLAGQAIGQVTDFLRDSVQAAREDELSQARLGAALRANVADWDGNKEAIERRVAAGTAAAFSDDELRTSLGSLAAATHDVSDAFDLQAIAVDLARFKNEDLASATDELVKVQAGNFRSLKSLGIETANIKTSTEAFAAIQKVVAGQSEAFLATDAGKAEKLNVAIQELSESFGHLATGPLADAAKVLTDFFNILNGVQQAGFDQQAKDISDSFKTATRAGLEAARQEIVNAIARNQHLFAGTPLLGDLPIGIGNMAGETDRLTGLLRDLDNQLALTGSSMEDTGQAAIFLNSQAAAAGGSVSDLDGAAETLIGTLAAGAGAFDTNVEAMADLASSMHNSTTDAELLAAALNALPTNIDINVLTTFTTSQSGGGVETSGQDPLALHPFTAGGGSAHGNADTIARDHQNRIDKANADAKSARDKANRDAKQAAQDLARAQIDAGTEAFDKLTKAAHDYFDKLHAMNLKDIADAQAAADAKIDAQKKANTQAVDDVEKAFKAIKDARQLAQLQADVAAAQTPEEKAAAQQALSDFVVQQQIDQMQATADAENAKLDIKKKADDADFANQTSAENDRYHAQVTAFDESLAELRKYLAKHPAEWAKATANVIAVLKLAGVDYKAAGLDNANAYIAGVNAAFGGTPVGGTGKGGRTAGTGATIGTDIGNIGHLSAGLATGGGNGGAVYLDGRLVGEWMDLREGQLNGIYNPVIISTGPTR